MDTLMTTSVVPLGLHTVEDLANYVDSNNNNPNSGDKFIDLAQKRQRSQNSSPGRPMKEAKYETPVSGMDLVTKVGDIIDKTQKNLARVAKEGQDTLRHLHHEVASQTEVIKELQRQYELLKKEKEASDKRTIELETLVGKQAIELEGFKKEQEKENK